MVADTKPIQVPFDGRIVYSADIMGIFLNGIYLLTLLAAAPWMAWRALRTGRYREGWSAKLFGLVPKIPNHSKTAGDSESIWFHAVSVGEVQVLRPLIREFQSRHPEATLSISCTTKTGMELAQKLFPKIHHFYFPMDFTWAVRRALRRVHPKLLILVELELWPNLVQEAKRTGVNVAVINGRLSERSFRGYGHIGWLMRRTLKQVDWIGAQDSIYAERFRALGAPEDCVSVTGSLKFDGAETDREHREVESRKRILGLKPEHRVWVVGSTQAPEEKYALDAFLRLCNRFPNLRMIVVPRHPERFEEVQQLLQGSDTNVIRWSEVGVRANADNWQILLADTIGELRWLWGLAEFGFVGGSFGNRGGQNMIEPAAYGVAVSFGPNTKNFRDIVRLLLDANAVSVLDEPEQLEHWLETMLSNPRQAQAFGHRAAQVAISHRGATSRTMDGLGPFLKKQPKQQSRAA